MPSLIHFSATEGDFLFVEQDADEVVQALESTPRSLVRVTRVPRQSETSFDPMPAWVNRDRVAFVTPSVAD